MEAIVANIVVGLAVRMREAGIKMIIEDILPCWGDPMGMEIVFSNLIDNAIKYRAEQDGWIRLHGELQGSFVEYTIEDNGIGIAPKFREKVFQLFTRLVSKSEYEGDGVGLASVRALVQRMHGDVFLRDPLEKEGKTCFVVRIPAVTS